MFSFHTAPNDLKSLYAFDNKHVEDNTLSHFWQYLEEIYRKLVSYM